MLAVLAGVAFMGGGSRDGGRTLNGVSGRVLSSLVAGARRHGISIARISDDLALDVAGLAGRGERISWETFTRVVDGVAGELGGPAELRQWSEAQLTTEPLGIIRNIGRVLASPRDVYFMGARWLGPSLFPMIHAEMWEGPDGILFQRLTIQSGHRDCPALFHILHGALTALPRAWGHGASHVSLELTPGSALYAIRPSSTRRGLLSRIVRGVRARFAFPTMLRELEEQQVAIDASYRELRDAHSHISAQAADLARVDSIGRELSKDVDLDRVLDALIRILTEDLAFAGAELWLMDPRGQASGGIAIAPEPMRRARQHGRIEGPAGHRHALESAGRRLGELVVHPSPAHAAGGPSQVLELLMPWIALAIDNALTYARLERHAEVLEDRVQERTARLLDANHQLVREMDERKRATDALLQSEAQRRAAERLASIGTLAAGIAHEINNPVGAILAAAQLSQLLRSDPGADDQLESALADIVSEAKRCGDIVRSVLQFAREERTDKWECALRDIVIRSIRLTAAFAEKHGARLAADLPEASPWARANPTQLEQAIVNLIRNAIESGASEIRVALRVPPDEPLAAIEVSDDGIGISESDRLRILEPFYTTRRATGGTGLGLSVVHGIALEHGGSLAIESRPGRGAAITLTIPRLERAPDAIQALVAPPATGTDPI